MNTSFSILVISVESRNFAKYFVSGLCVCGEAESHQRCHLMRGCVVVVMFLGVTHVTHSIDYCLWGNDRLHCSWLWCPYFVRGCGDGLKTTYLTSVCACVCNFADS